MATLDPETGEIEIMPAFIGELSLDVDFNQHVPIVNIRDANNTSLFAIYLAPEKLADNNAIELLNGNYSLLELTEPHFGEFADGICIQNAAGICEVYVSLD